jgi:hypothetical protein
MRSETNHVNSVPAWLGALAIEAERIYEMMPRMMGAKPMLSPASQRELSNC